MNEREKAAYVCIALIISIALCATAMVYHSRAQNTKESASEGILGAQNPSSLQNSDPAPAAINRSTHSSYENVHGSDDCTDDCSGHDAGYEYAEENEICDTDYSDSYSDSFNEGVIAWAEDNC